MATEAMRAWLAVILLALPAPAAAQAFSAGGKLDADQKAFEEEWAKLDDPTKQQHALNRYLNRQVAAFVVQYGSQVNAILDGARDLATCKAAFGQMVNLRTTATAWEDRLLKIFEKISIEARLPAQVDRLEKLMSAATDILKWAGSVPTERNRVQEQIRALEWEWGRRLGDLQDFQKKMEKNAISDSEVKLLGDVRTKLKNLRADLVQLRDKESPQIRIMRERLQRAQAEGVDISRLQKVTEVLIESLSVRDLVASSEIALEMLDWPEKGTARKRLDAIASAKNAPQSAKKYTEDINLLDKKVFAIGVSDRALKASQLWSQYQSKLAIAIEAPIIIIFAGDADGQLKLANELKAEVLKGRAPLLKYLETIEDLGKEAPPVDKLGVGDMKVKGNEYASDLLDDYTKNRDALMSVVAKATSAKNDSADKNPLALKQIDYKGERIDRVADDLKKMGAHWLDDALDQASQGTVDTAGVPNPAKSAWENFVKYLSLARKTYSAVNASKVNALRDDSGEAAEAKRYGVVFHSIVELKLMNLALSMFVTALQDVPQLEEVLKDADAGGDAFLGEMQQIIPLTGERAFQDAARANDVPALNRLVLRKLPSFTVPNAPSYEEWTRQILAERKTTRDRLLRSIKKSRELFAKLRVAYKQLWAWPKDSQTKLKFDLENLNTMKQAESMMDDELDEIVERSQDFETRLERLLGR